MTPAVVDVFKVVDIQSQHRERLAQRAVILQHRIQTTAIQQLGQRIGLRFRAKTANLVLHQTNTGEQCTFDLSRLKIPGGDATNLF